jgi:LacI family transcriptional regulator
MSIISATDPERENNSTSLGDVARHARVSLATASRVVSGSSYPVSEKLRRRVLEAVAELGYRPNVLPRTLVEPRSHIIGVIVGDITDPYFSEIARGVEDYARPFDYLSIVCSTDRNLAAELAYLEMLQEQHARGIIFAGGMYTDTKEAGLFKQGMKAAAERGTRLVTLAERNLDLTPVITVDNQGMLYDLTNYLVQLGHRRIGFVGGPPGFSTAELRLKGYLEACRRANIEPLTYPGGFDFEHGRAATLRALGESLPDAIIGANDESAIGILMTLRQAGIGVPEQVSVAGVDDIRYAEVVDLTTIEVPMYELGAMAARLIIQDEENLPLKTILPHRIVPRSTTARARIANVPGRG